MTDYNELLDQLENEVRDIYGISATAAKAIRALQERLNEGRIASEDFASLSKKYQALQEQVKELEEENINLHSRIAVLQMEVDINNGGEIGLQKNPLNG